MKKKETKNNEGYQAEQEVFYAVLAGMVVIVLVTTMVELSSYI